MREQIITTTMLLILISSFAGAQVSRREFIDSQKKHPYALLTDDHEILNAEDLVIGSCFAWEKPISKDSRAYPYWQCFPKKKVSLVCDRENDERDSILAIVIAQNEGNQEYLSRRAISLENCHWFQKQWKAFTSNQTHVCLSGSFDDLRVDEKGKNIKYWTFDKFKTKRGCVSYFNGDCDLSRLRK